MLATLSALATDEAEPLLVGGFQMDPVSNRWGPLPSSPWQRHVVFHRANTGSGASAGVVRQIWLDKTVYIP